MVESFIIFAFVLLSLLHYLCCLDLDNGLRRTWSYLVFHDEDFLNGGALPDDTLDLGPGVEAAHDGTDFGLVNGVNDAVITQVRVQRHNGDVVLESGESGYWKQIYSQISSS
jgi:hypothetical protein